MWTPQLAGILFLRQYLIRTFANSVNANLRKLFNDLMDGEIPFMPRIVIIWTIENFS